MRHRRRRRDELQREIEALEREVGRLTALREELAGEQGGPAVQAPPSLAYVDPDDFALDDDDDEARAFEVFYRAYDDVHDKTRKFLLG